MMFHLMRHGFVSSIFRFVRLPPRCSDKCLFKTASYSWQKDEGEVLQKDELKKEDSPKIVDLLKNNEISQKMRGEMSPRNIIRKLDIKDPVLCCETKKFLIQKGFADSYNQRHRGKVFNDPVHGHIELPPLCIKIIDTPQFQRLRYLKQMGTCDFVYPGAVHTRFEHSLGVCYLAGLLIKHLKRLQPSLGITDEDVLCVQIAGLCHDMGHGPFSHLFDNLFAQPETEGKKRKHEDISIAMFDHMYEDPFNGLAREFENYGLGVTDRTFIKEQIAGPLTEKKEYEGRPGKRFLYDIVANERNGIDVDKWDYICRDSLHLGLKTSFDHHRFIHFARVMTVGENQELQIGLRDKEAYGIFQMYQTRYFIFKIACHHRVASATSHMIADALKEANKVPLVPNADGTMFKLSECLGDKNLDVFTNLTDEVIRQIVLSPDNQLEKSREILRNIWRRKLYECVGETPPIKNGEFKDVQKIKKEILQYLPRESVCRSEHEGSTCEDQVIVEVIDFNFGKTNPLEKIQFYSKEKPDDARPLSSDELTSLVPPNFKEQVIRVILKPSGSDATVREKKKELSEAFTNWMKDHIK